MDQTFTENPRDIIDIHNPITINITALAGRICINTILYEIQIGLVDTSILVDILKSITGITIYHELWALAGI